MIRIFAFLFQFTISLFISPINLLIKYNLALHELNILKRKMDVKRVRIDRIDKFILVLLNLIGNIKDSITIFSPNTLLKWQKHLLKSFWTFMNKDSHPGRPPVPADVKNIILQMKNENLFWGAKRIRDELLMKLKIKLDKKTIRNILRDFRRRGKIKTALTWKKFLQSQIDSIFAMDFFTVDTLFNERFYVLFIISHKTREIVQCAISQFPNREFVKQQLIIFEENAKSKVFMIRDRTGQFYLDYSFYNIVDVCTSVEAPNMNSIAERFVKSIRNEALDNFLLFNHKQVSKIIFSYIEYYNNIRPHQGINSIPKGVPPDYEQCSHELKGIVCSKNVLGGLVKHYYYRDAA
jgi:putative transposase